MNRQLVEILVCPLCKGKLVLSIEKEAGGDILAGSLHCPHCEARYLIADGIPRLIPPGGCA